MKTVQSVAMPVCTGSVTELTVSWVLVMGE